NSSAGGLYRILSSYSLAHFYLMKNFGLDCGLLEYFKYSTYEPSSKHKIEMYRGPQFFRDRVGGKNCGLSTYNSPAKEVKKFR
ncbi:MAG: hypothetical protein ACK559_16480, partial [bacterium]